MIIKLADKGGDVVILPIDCYQSMIMLHILNDKNLDSCINNKIQSKLLRFLRQYKTCFTEKFLNVKHHEVSNFCGLPKINKSKIIESVINTQNSEIIEIFKPNDLKLRPIVGGLNCQAKKINQLFDIPLKRSLKHINSHIHNSMDFFN